MSQLWCWQDQDGEEWLIPAVPCSPLPAHFRLFLYLAAIQHILVLLRHLCVKALQWTYAHRYTELHTHTTGAILPSRLCNAAASTAFTFVYLHKATQQRHNAAPLFFQIVTAGICFKIFWFWVMHTKCHSLCLIILPNAALVVYN